MTTPMELLTLEGHLPAVREIKHPHGEAPTYEAKVVSVGGPPYAWVVTIDFGYQREGAEKIAKAMAAAPELLEDSRRLLDVLDAAGLLNLSNGVELGATSWFIKAMDATRMLRAALAKAGG